jgi:UPF0755 protein
MMLWFCLTIAAVFFIGVFCIEAGRPPKDFPDPAVVAIPNGTSVAQAAKILHNAHVIRSEFLFVNSVIFFRRERALMGGEYYFEKPVGVFSVADRITSGDYQINQLRTTIPEGSSVADISLILKKNYPQFDAVHFVTLAHDKEGYLFPDTYYFGADPDSEKIIETMTSTFSKKISQPEINATIRSSGIPLKDIIIMASILEGEARQTRTRQIVAGILWERIRLGIPLQVDATFKYINGKPTKDLTIDDLKIDSPYNTYLYKGLPPTPISNPGLDAIVAVVNPVKTDFIYFLTGTDGTMYYAKTLEEHKRNKELYLK